MWNIYLTSDFNLRILILKSQNSLFSKYCETDVFLRIEIKVRILSSSSHASLILDKDCEESQNWLCWIRSLLVVCKPAETWSQNRRMMLVFLSSWCWLLASVSCWQTDCKAMFCFLFFLKVKKSLSADFEKMLNKMSGLLPAVILQIFFVLPAASSFMSQLGCLWADGLNVSEEQLHSEQQVRAETAFRTETQLEANLLALRRPDLLDLSHKEFHRNPLPALYSNMIYKWLCIIMPCWKLPCRI